MALSQLLVQVETVVELLQQDEFDVVVVALFQEHLFFFVVVHELHTSFHRLAIHQFYLTQVLTHLLHVVFFPGQAVVLQSDFSQMAQLLGLLQV